MQRFFLIQFNNFAESDSSCLKINYLNIFRLFEHRQA